MEPVCTGTNPLKLRQTVRMCDRSLNVNMRSGKDKEKDKKDKETSVNSGVTQVPLPCTITLWF